MPSNASVAEDTQYAGDQTASVAKLRVEWVYRYRPANCRSNIHLTENTELVYVPAAADIVQSIKVKDNFRKEFFSLKMDSSSEEDHHCNSSNGQKLSDLRMDYSRGN
jgi:hypothetical protein